MVLIQKIIDFNFSPSRYLMFAVSSIFSLNHIKIFSIETIFQNVLNSVGQFCLENFWVHASSASSRLMQSEPEVIFFKIYRICGVNLRSAVVYPL